MTAPASTVLVTPPATHTTVVVAEEPHHVVVAAPAHTTVVVAEEPQHRPGAFTVQSSFDGVAWIDEWAVAQGTWEEGVTTRTFNRPAP